jgi:uncharacterized protein (TIGR02145 family)
MKKIYLLLFVISLNNYAQNPGNGLSDIDGNTYSSVIIGTQEWQKENLNVSKYSDGTPIPQVTDPTEWANLTTGAWCYYSNTSSNSTTYGKLYNWYAVAGIYDSASLADPSLRKQIGVSGWHVPSETEWSELINYIDPTANGGDIYPNSVGGKLKDVGTLNWASPNIEATNTSGFTAMPGGFRGNDGPFYNIGAHGNWWSSTAATDNTNAFDIILKHDSGSVIKNAYIRQYGFSVRLLKNTTTNDQSSSFCTSLSGSLASGLVGYWPFCGNANDYSGYGNNGAVNGATLTTDRFGNTNSAYNFDGSDFISIPNSTSLSNMTSITMSAWININQWDMTNNQGWFPILSKTNSSSYGKYRLGANTSISGQQPSFYGTLSTDEGIISQNNLYALNQWNQIVITISNGNSTISLNGVQVFNGATTYTGWTTIDNLPLLIGKDIPGLVDHANGKIDDIGIWNRALTQQEITQLYNQNQCITNVTVTDTLIINVGQMSYTNPVAYANNITIYPNPASSQINISFNNITDLSGGTIKIINSLGQQVATTPITLTGTSTSMALSSWGGNGVYFVQILNAQGQIVDIKKIILQ